LRRLSSCVLPWFSHTVILALSACGGWGWAGARLVQQGGDWCPAGPRAGGADAAGAAPRWSAGGRAGRRGLVHTRPTHPTHLEPVVAVLAVLAHIARSDAPHDLGQRLPAVVATLADAAQEGAQQAALVCQTLLVVLGGEAAAEAACEVGRLLGGSPAGWEVGGGGGGGRRPCGVCGVRGCARSRTTVAALRIAIPRVFGSRRARCRSARIAGITRGMPTHFLPAAAPRPPPRGGLPSEPELEGEPGSCLPAAASCSNAKNPLCPFCPRGCGGVPGMLMPGR
jgi:hypothetical protein